MGVPPVDQLLKLPLSLQREPEGLEGYAEVRRQKEKSSAFLIFSVPFVPSVVNLF